jgi:hypothetical protein
LIVHPKPNSQHQIICNFSSYWDEVHLNTINANDFSAYSQLNLERTQYLNKVSIEELWLRHQTFLSSICSQESLQIMSFTEWEEKIQQTSCQFVESYVGSGKAYWMNKLEMTYRKNPFTTLRFIAKIAKYQKFNAHQTIF